MKTSLLTDSRMGQIALAMFVRELAKEGVELKVGVVAEHAKRLARGGQIEVESAHRFLLTIVVPALYKKTTGLDSVVEDALTPEVWEPLAVQAYRLWRADYGYHLPPKREVPKLITELAEVCEATETEVISFHLHMLSCYIGTSVPGCKGCSITVEGNGTQN